MSFIIKNINRFFKYLDFLFNPKPDKYRPKNTLCSAPKQRAACQSHLSILDIDDREVDNLRRLFDSFCDRVVSIRLL
jgi:hypothetical protein